MKGLIMKRMIFGRIYDTESAELIADFVDDNGLSEAIYCEPDGTCFFLQALAGLTRYMRNTRSMSRYRDPL